MILHKMEGECVIVEGVCDGCKTTQMWMTFVITVLMIIVGAGFTIGYKNIDTNTEKLSELSGVESKYEVLETKINNIESNIEELKTLRADIQDISEGNIKIGVIQNIILDKIDKL